MIKGLGRSIDAPFSACGAALTIVLLWSAPAAAQQGQQKQQAQQAQQGQQQSEGRLEVGFGVVWHARGERKGPETSAKD